MAAVRLEAIRALTDVLVTGASGFAGSHLIDLLRQSGASITGWRRSGHPSPEQSPSVDWQAVDLLDGDAVRQAIAEVRPSRVFHCAGAAHVGQSWEDARATLATNVLGTHHLLNGLRVAGIRARVLIPGSSYVYRPSDRALKEPDPVGPASPYALSKLAQELAGCGDPGGPDVLLARAFNHFGPRQDPWFVASGFARRIADIEAGRWAAEIAVGNLDTRRDLTDVRDTVRAYRLILERGTPGRPYNVCSGRAIAIRELLEMMLTRARVPIRIVVDPARYRPNDLPLVVGDPSRIRDELGWTAQIPIERAVDDLLEFWRSQ
jgi:GDP-4-dehydro-6-deoxy-D-mannose reductase